MTFGSSRSNWLVVRKLCIYLPSTEYITACLVATIRLNSGQLRNSCATFIRSKELEKFSLSAQLSQPTGLEKLVSTKLSFLASSFIRSANFSELPPTKFAKTSAASLPDGISIAFSKSATLILSPSTNPTVLPTLVRSAFRTVTSAFKSTCFMVTMAVISLVRLAIAASRPDSSNKALSQSSNHRPRRIWPTKWAHSNSTPSLALLFQFERRLFESLCLIPQVFSLHGLYVGKIQMRFLYRVWYI